MPAVATTPSTETLAKTPIHLAGDTSQFSLISVLLALEQDQLTGLLRVGFNNSKPLEMYVAAGRPVLVTLRDPAAYLRNSGHKLTPEQIRAAGKYGATQTKTGSPIFMQFVEDKLMTLENAVAICQRQNLRLFAGSGPHPRSF